MGAENQKICISSWICRFLAGPIVALVALNGMPKWQREKVVNGVNLLVIFLGHLVFLVCYVHANYSMLLIDAKKLSAQAKAKGM